MNDQPRILVLAHEPQWRAFVAQVLSAHGYEVKLCTDTQSALHEIWNNGFDLVIVDALMEDLLSLLATESVSYRLLVVSATPSVPEAIRVYRLGALDYINKAFGESSLLTTVENVLRKQPARQRFPQ